MTTEKARKIAEEIRNSIWDSSMERQAITILDDRIKELEGELQQLQKEVGLTPIKNYISDLQKVEEQRDELLEAAIRFCTWWYKNPRIHDVPIPVHQAIFRAVEKVKDQYMGKIKNGGVDPEKKKNEAGEIDTNGYLWEDLEDKLITEARENQKGE